jgi:hypothetical protein
LPVPLAWDSETIPAKRGVSSMARDFPMPDKVHVVGRELKKS